MSAPTAAQARAPKLLAPLLLVPVLVLAACGSFALTVPSRPHPAGAPAFEVGTPPPPARIEHVDATPPAPGCRWVDGHWAFRRTGYRWVAGGWVQPQQGCRYALPTMSWVARGATSVLYYRPGRWYSEADAVCPDPPRCGEHPPADPAASPSSS